MDNAIGLVPKPDKQLGVAPDRCLGLYSFLADGSLLATESLGSVLELAARTPRGRTIRRECPLRDPRPGRSERCDSNLGRTVRSLPRLLCPGTATEIAFAGWRRCVPNQGSLLYCVRYGIVPIHSSSH
jgi:hypothetical protein